ncbi:tRNA (guanosine(46)-N7)-methyltransferase TrmB [Maritalea mediterranea]|uniref:tRNA (guanine-N(7)-)-methyltransferase n=1 Tax=Maritalea mediterranea TaxID=2909667 RepID=A0ABS9E5D1_9HYPH|nr:tRNA (guanosine(46)-N7)-methyltransferase TrmB [Maritalea mediterranea]MCF4097005.1 tRNA (guanosine(46)-N7)-methyltransferase TrmB [Maritalea mediterranea]
MIEKNKSDFGLEAERRAFFGRRSTHKLTPTQQKLMDELMPNIEIRLEEAALDPATLFQNAQAPLMLEIGYGGGEHLARHAKANPDKNFIGCEPFIDGVGKMLAKIDADGLNNVRLYREDALHLLRALPDQSIAGAYLLYPDPWPKKRHHKRRFINPVTLGELSRLLKPGAEFRVATDIDDYATWVLAHMVRRDDFVWQPQKASEWRDPWTDWEPTRYEEKARREGRSSYYFSFYRK